MCYLSPVFLLALAYVYGTLIKVIIRDDDDRISESCLIGTFFVIILWEAMVLVSDEMGIDFRYATMIFATILLVLFVPSLWIVRNRIRRTLDIQSSIDPAPVIIVAVAVIMSSLCFFIFTPDTKYDSSVETVNTLLVTDSFFDYDYLTGRLREVTPSFLDKCNALTTFYGFLANVYNEKSANIVYRCVPMWTLALSFMGYSMWAEMYFEKDSKKTIKTALFVLGVGVIDLCGAFAENSIFYYQILKGFSADTFCFCVIIPFTIYECFCIYRLKRIKSIVYLVLAGAAVLFVNALVKGIIPFLLCNLICIVVMLAFKIRRYIKCRK